VSPGGIEIRVFRAGDETRIVDGINGTRRTPISLEDWSWSYPPVPGGRPIVVAVQNDTVVAHIGGVVSSVHLERQTVSALGLTDVFALRDVGADDERRRLLTELLAAIQTGFGGGDRYRLIYRLGVSRGDGDPSEILGGSEVEPPPVAALCRREAARSRVLRLAYRAEAARDWEPRLDDLWRRVRRWYPWAAVRDAEWALHRHAAHPRSRRHGFLVFPRFSRHAVAFAVFETDGDCCRWVDLLWDHHRPGALDLLCHVSRRLADQVGAAVERIVLGGDADAVARLRSAGFRSENSLRGFGLSIFASPPGVDARSFTSRWYLTQTDLDPLRRQG
jgi:hypothetical protein